MLTPSIGRGQEGVWLVALVGVDWGFTAEFGLNNTEALRGTLAEGCENIDGCEDACCDTPSGRNTEFIVDAGAGPNFGAGIGWPLPPAPGEETEFPSGDESLALTLKLLARFLGTYEVE